MASSGHESIASEDEKPRRICNLDWDSDYDAHRFGPSWESYPMSSDGDSDADKDPCRECLSDLEDDEPHFRVQLLHGSLTLPLVSDGPLMDPSIWSRLPPHLLERSLIMVPPAFSFRLVLVCKSWLSLISSPHFKKLRFEHAKAGHYTGRARRCASSLFASCKHEEGPSRRTLHSKKPDAKCLADGGKGEELNDSADLRCPASHDSLLPSDDVARPLAGKSEVDAHGLQDSSCMASQGKKVLSKKAGKRPLKSCSVDGGDEFLCSITEHSDNGSTSRTARVDDIDLTTDEDFFLNGMSDAVCALEYQPGRLCPGCQPRMSDIAFFDENPVYKIYTSFLPEKFRFFLPLDCIVQDGFVCLFKAESFASTDGIGKMKRLCFCVANPITKAWKELPSEVCTHGEFKEWREDWTVRLEVQNDNFTVCLITPRLKDGCITMSVNTYSSKTGAWKLTFAQSMRYMTPAYALEGEGKWPCYTISKGFLCTTNYRRSTLETMVHDLETGELVYFQDDLGSSSEEDDLGENPPLRVRGSSAPMVTYESGMCLPFKVASSCKGFYFVARFLIEDTLEKIPALCNNSIRNALMMFLKERRQSGFAVWGLDLENGVWRKVSKSLMPQKMRRKLMKRPLLNPFKAYKGRGPKDVRILYVDEAVVAGDTIYMFLGLKEDYNFLVCDGDLRLWSGMVAYNMSHDTWKLIYNGLVPRLHGNEWHVFRPNFTDLCLC